MGISERLYWMDLIRGICILLVLLVHASEALKISGFSYPDGARFFNQAFELYRMPLLMFLSGMLLHRSLKKEPSENIYGKFALIFWPFLVWSMAIYVAEGRLDLITILKTPISAPSLLWYLWFICAYYVLSIVIDKKRIPVLFVIALTYFLSSIAPSWLRIDRFFYLFGFFMLGHFLVLNRFKLFENPCIGLLGLLAGIWGSFIAIKGTPSLIKYDIFYLWASFGVISFILWSTKRYKSSFVMMPIEWVGKNSIVFYAAHFPIQLAIAPVLTKLGGISSPYAYGIVFVGSMTLCAAITFLRGKFLFVAALFDFRLIASRINKWRS